MAGNVFNFIQHKVSKKQCPHCENHSLQTNLRCDIFPQACVAMIECRDCGEDFYLDGDLKSLAPLTGVSELNCNRDTNVFYLTKVEKVS